MNEYPVIIERIEEKKCVEDQWRGRKKRRQRCGDEAWLYEKEKKRCEKLQNEKGYPPC